MALSDLNESLYNCKMPELRKNLGLEQHIFCPHYKAKTNTASLLEASSSLDFMEPY